MYTQTPEVTNTPTCRYNHGDYVACSHGLSIYSLRLEPRFGNGIRREFGRQTASEMMSRDRAMV